MLIHFPFNFNDFQSWKLLELQNALMTLQVLYAQDIDLRSATFEKAIEMASLHQRRARMTILRSAILKNNIFIKNQQQQNRGDHSEVAN